MAKKRPVGDKIVWVEGANGVKTTKWLSTIKHRVDLRVLEDWKPKSKRTVKKKTPATSGTAEAANNSQE